MIFLNLTNNTLLDVVLQKAISKTLEFNVLYWKVFPINSPEANCVYRECYSNDDRGLSLKGSYIVTPVPENMDYIHWHDNLELLGYLSNMQEIIPSAVFSSTHYMDANGFMDWHTNKGESPVKPYRLYITYNDSEGSFFKYIPTGSNQVVTFNEPIGWYAKVFYVEEELLHCVKSNANRYSIGMRFSI